MKMPKFLIIYILVVWPIIAFALLSIITGKACISYEGFAIDRDSNLYLGKDYVIEVLDSDGNFLRNINPYTGRGYSFTVTKDNTLKISTGEYLYETDLYGNLINKKKIKDYKDDELLRVSKYKYECSNGTVYIRKNHFLRTYIYRLNGTEKEVFYKMPVFDYIIRILSVLYCISMAIVVPIAVYKTRKQKKQQEMQENKVRQ